MNGEGMKGVVSGLARLAACAKYSVGQSVQDVSIG